MKISTTIMILLLVAALVAGNTLPGFFPKTLLNAGNDEWGS
tara:strand:+ start:1449 stop:1571 length:123 start_codon:yes stop_codon:yes gene_type:complete